MKQIIFSLFIGIFCCGMSFSTNAQNIEVEPNQSKMAATPVSLIANNQIITGISANVSDIDYFKLTDLVSSTTIRENTLSLTTSGTKIYQFELTIRGVSQNNGVITSTETTVQFSKNSSTPAVRWYSFGKNEVLYISVKCSATSTEPYTLTWTQQNISLSVLPNVLPNGSLTLSTTGVTSAHSNTDMWVYDANFNAIPLAGNDDNAMGNRAKLTQNFAAGTYYVALSNENLANNQSSPSEDVFRDGNVVNEPNLLISSGLNNGNIPLTFENSYFSFTQNPNLTNTRNFRVIWFKFTVINVSLTVSQKQLCNGSELQVNVQASPVSATLWNNGNVQAVLSDNTGNVSSPIQTKNLSLAYANNTFSGSCVFNLANSLPSSDRYKIALSALSQILYKPADSLTIFNLSQANLPNTAGTYSANGQCLDATGWTHYFNTTNNQVLLSIEKGTSATDIGNIGDTGFGVEITVTPQAGATPLDLGTSSSNPAPYTNNSHWWLMSRCWNLHLKNGGTQPTGAVNIRTYFQQQDVNELQTAVSNAGGNFSNLNQLIFYKINGNYDPNPATYHANVPEAEATANDGIRMYVAGNQPSLTTWTLGMLGTYYYGEMEVLRFSGGGAGVTANNLMPLPAEALLLTANYEEVAKKVNLQWTHGNEQNTLYYQILRADENMNWAEISRITELHQGQNEGNYFYQDSEPLATQSFYKILKVNIDGETNSSNIVEMHAVQAVLSLNLYPNPVLNKATLQFYSNQATDAKIEIFTSNGQLLHSQTQSLSLGTQAIDLDLEHLVNGIYFCKIKAERQASLVVKFVKL
ncbi:MAG: T9SS type A sorting domain-containing protein [Bacteroidia bacterium]